MGSTRLEQVTGIEPVSTAWKAVVIAIIRHLQANAKRLLPKERVHLSGGRPLFQADLPWPLLSVKLKSMKAEIYTDGSCIGNPGPGGWAFLLRLEKNETRKQGGTVYTTNNRMELSAVIEGLKWLGKEHPAIKEITLYSDSSWVVNTMKLNWKRKKNLDLWAELAPLLEGKKITWQWVRGHSGHKENEDFDVRANREAYKQRNSGGGF